VFETFVSGKIYVVGGNDGISALNSIEIYDPDTHTWSLGPVLRLPRANCGVAVLNDILYVVGGFNGKKFLNSIEALDLKVEYRKKDSLANGKRGSLNGSLNGSTKSDEVITNGGQSVTAQCGDVITNGAA